MSPSNTTKKPAKRNPGRKKSSGFSAEERAAMKERVQELKGTGKTEGKGAVLAKIAEMPKSDRAMAKRLHKLIMDTAPGLAPRTWYGMPAYSNEDGKVVCFFQGADKFKARYSTLGFNDAAKLDDGAMWPTSFALKKLGAAEEKKIRALVKKAVS